MNSSRIASREGGRLRWAYSLGLALSAIVYVLISIGGLVRNAGAGLSCPDWPLCYEQVLPKQMLDAQAHGVTFTEAQIFVEWFHRLIAGSVSVGLLVLSILIFSTPALRARAGRFCALAITLLFAQVVLGGLTVLGLLSPKWVTSHLAVGQAFFGCILMITLRLRELKRGTSARVQSQRFLGLGIAALLLVYGQVILGGLVSSNYAGLACLDFPTCNGQWLPPLEGGVRFQFFHRLGAVIAAAAVFGFAARTWMAGVSRLASSASKASLLLVLGQVLLGVGMVVFHLPLLMSVAHLAVATAILGLLVVMNSEIRHG